MRTPKPISSSRKIWFCASAAIPPVGSGRLQRANIETPRCLGHAAVEQDQTEQENEAAKREINCDFPRSSNAISTAPNPDEQKRRNQRQFVKGVKEEEVNRCESANGTARDQQKAGVKARFDASRFRR